MIQDSNTNVTPTYLLNHYSMEKLIGYYVKPSKVKNGLGGINSSEVKKSFYFASSSVLNTLSFLLDPSVFMLISLTFSTFFF